ncbi:MAG TPA: amidohydrolase, partial [Terriglobales bacterium]
MKWIAVLLCCVFAGAVAQSRPTADLIITNAKIWTVDPAQPVAEAVAVRGERILAVGSAADIDALRGPNTKVIDAAGKLILPGFNDAHVHFIDGGRMLDSLQLTDATSTQEFVQRIAEWIKKTPKGEWVTGGDWDETRWSPPKLPSKELIDPISNDVPVFLHRHDGHMALANSVVLRLAGITEQTPDPVGGIIEHDQKGNPTGILKDAAQGLVYKVMPPLTDSQRLRAAKKAIAYAASLGVTSVQNMNPEYADIAAYAQLLRQGELTTRIYAAPLITHGAEDQAKIGIDRAFGGPYLRIGAVKAYADGSLGARTAYMFEPYSDEPGNRGLLGAQMQPLSLMRDRMMTADAAGIQICTHAIGDQAISMTLDLYHDIVKAHHGSDHRFRIEHAQHVAAKDFDRFAQLGVIASVQPYQAIDDGRWAEARIGHDRASRTYAFRTFLNHGVHLAFGTDWDVV